MGTGPEPEDMAELGAVLALVEDALSAFENLREMGVANEPELEAMFARARTDLGWIRDGLRKGVSSDVLLAGLNKVSEMIRAQ